MVSDEVLDDWFCREVLPLERSLTHFIHRNWRVVDDVTDLRHDVYELAFAGARRELPVNARQYLFTIARNHLINAAKRAKIVSFDHVADLETIERDVDFLGTERHLVARESLRRVVSGLEKLSPRLREIVKLRKIEGLDPKETAERLGITRIAVNVQLVMAMKALTDHVLGGSGRVVRPRYGIRRRDWGQSMSRAEQAADRAAQWVLAEEESGWSDTDQAALEEWLAASDGNRTAYLRLRHGWREADRLGALGHADPEAERASLHRKMFRWPLPTAIAASIALAVGGSYVVDRQSFTPATGQVTSASYATKIGARRLVGFSDGSTVQLNTASRLRTAIRPEKREVWVDQGEAFFEVAHRDGQPFIVHAGNRQVTVLGTKFAVRRDGDKVTVTVTVTVLEGRVKVDELIDGHPVRSSVIVGGDIAFAEGKSTLVTTRSEQKVEDALAWREGMLSFDQANLGDIAREFNRYNIRKLIVTDAQLARIRIGGMFPSNDPEAFIELLRNAYGLKVEETPTEVRISS